jgi:hypothetical protein
VSSLLASSSSTLGVSPSPLSSQAAPPTLATAVPATPTPLQRWFRFAEPPLSLGPIGISAYPQATRWSRATAPIVRALLKRHVLNMTEDSAQWRNFRARLRPEGDGGAIVGDMSNIERKHFLMLLTNTSSNKYVLLRSRRAARS